jgi:hypothetical protein
MPGMPKGQIAQASQRAAGACAAALVFTPIISKNNSGIPVLASRMRSKIQFSRYRLVVAVFALYSCASNVKWMHLASPNSSEQIRVAALFGRSRGQTQSGYGLFA